MLPVSFHPDVKKEIKDSFNWYQEQSLGLGHEFAHEIKESIDSIRSIPSAWSKMGQRSIQNGKILYPKTAIGELGWVAEFEDCEGNCIALHSSHG